jgi:hypothetical protein
MSVQSPNMTAFVNGHAGGDALQDVLQAATRRIRLLRLLRSGSVGLCYGALGCLLLVGLGKVAHSLAPSPWLLVSLLVLALVLATLHALLPRLTALDVARLTESRADLKERLSSALEFQRMGLELSAPFYGEQLSDANRYAAAVDIKQLYPARIPRTLPVGILLCLALCGIYFLPGLPVFWSPQKKAEMAEVKARGIELLKVAEDKEKTADQQKLDETKKAAAEARKLAEAMRHGKLEKKDALVAMQKLTKKMEDQQRKLSEKQAPKSLDQAGKDFKKSMDQMQKDVERSRKEQAAKQEQQKMAARDMKQAMDKANQEQKQSDAMKQAMKAMQQMSQAMENQSPQQMQQSMEQMAKAMQSGTMSKQEMQQMAQMMQSMAQSLQNTQMNSAAQQMAQMAQMMQAMQSMDAKSMQQLAAMMKKIGGMCKNPGNGMGLMDAKELAELLQALKDGRMTMCMGTKPGNGGRRAGLGVNGYGGEDKAMKDIDKTNPRLMVNNEKRLSKAPGKSGSAQELMKYMAMASPPPKHLPNAKINGQRTQQGQELSMQMTGDPEPTHSTSPYYQAVETSRRQAESTLDKENIPASMKKQVRDYFDSIKP